MNEPGARIVLQIAFLLGVVGSTSGCTSLGKTLKGWLGGKSSPDGIEVSTPRFSEQENLRAGADERQYRRMNRSRLEEEADLRAEAGSLWVMEGQGAYLFSQNQRRMVGDPIGIRIEGGPKSQLQSKVRVISRLLERLEGAKRGASVREPAEANTQAQANQAGAKGGQGAGGDGGQDQQAAQAAAAANGTVNERPFEVPVVPTRIVEQLKDGSYRVRGMQPFMIGKREYKVIVTGIVRPEDFDDSGIDASKLLDPQFDIVSSRKGASL